MFCLCDFRFKVHFIKYVEASEKHRLTSSMVQVHPYLGWAMSLDFQGYFTVNFLGDVFFMRSS